MSRPDQSRGGFTFQWHINDNCNLSCSHCYRDAGVTGLPWENMTAIADDLMESALKMRVAPSFGITGGEPLLNPSLLFRLLDYLRDTYAGQLEFTVDLMSNGTLIDRDMARRLANYYPMLSAAQISLDGGSRAINDAIRGQGAYDAALAGVRNLHEHTQMSVSLSFTFHRGNAADLPVFLDVADEAEVRGLHITRLVPIGRGKSLSSQDQPLSPTEVQTTLRLIYERALMNEQCRSRGEHRPFILLARGLFHLVDQSEAIRRYQSGPASNRLGNACAVGSRTATIQADGTLLPCRRLPIPIADLKERKFLDAWYSDNLLWQFRGRQKRIRGKCQRCEFTTTYPGLCTGGSPCVTYGMTGDYNLPDPQCWWEPDGQ